MRTKIIEILQKRYPEHCMQHIDTADEIIQILEPSNKVPNFFECEVCCKPFGDLVSLYEHYKKYHQTIQLLQINKDI